MTASADFNPHGPQALRGKKRLKALGIDLDTASQDEIRQWYEAERARYIELAEAGLHMMPQAGLFGATTAALKDAHGWNDLPDGWSSAQVEWPTYVDRLRGARGK